MARTSLAATASALATLTLAACGTEPGEMATEGPPAEDPSPSETAMDDSAGADAGAPPQDPWPAPGTAVQTAGPVDVLDDGAGTSLCLGGMLESYPPQCGGLDLVGFDWTQHDGDYQNADGVRWGAFELTGRYDPTTQTMTVERSAPVGDHEPDPGPVPQPSQDVSAEELPADWPGLIGSAGSGTYYPAFVEVIYDDGTLTERLDAEFGADSVVVHATLIPAE